MTNNRQKLTLLEKTKLKKLPQLQRLRLEQLDGVAGGPTQSTDHDNTTGQQPS